MRSGCYEADRWIRPNIAIPICQNPLHGFGRFTLLVSEAANSQLLRAVIPWSLIENRDATHLRRATATNVGGTPISPGQFQQLALMRQWRPVTAARNLAIDDSI